ncbi:MAG: universal stress protein [Myxococcaceae bacterium]|nr:universal stress protein [Myxococcaceae bacterium]
MHTFTKVLCATDLSAAADVALKQAATVAGLYQAKLVVFHALPSALASTPLFPQDSLAANEGFVALERRVLEALHARVAAVAGRGAHVEVVLGTGSPHAEIVRTAENAKADLIVVGGEGAPNVARAVLGAVAERVIRYAHAPVWVARTGPDVGPVVAGTDFSAASNAAVDIAVEYARRAGAKVTLCHALSVEKLVPPPGPAVEQPAFPTWTVEDVVRLRGAATQKLSALVPDAELVVADERPGAALPALASKRLARLICVGTAGHTGLARILLGSVAEEVVRHAPCPVIVTRR